MVNAMVEVVWQWQTTSSGENKNKKGANKNAIYAKMQCDVYEIQVCQRYYTLYS